MKCQQMLRVPPIGAGSAVITGYCNLDVREWRECGAGCKVTIAYCEYHGGMARTNIEMSCHIATQHS